MQDLENFLGRSVDVERLWHCISKSQIRWCRVRYRLGDNGLYLSSSGTDYIREQLAGQVKVQAENVF